jgi:hypothetical protein
LLLVWRVSRNKVALYQGGCILPVCSDIANAYLGQQRIMNLSVSLLEGKDISSEVLTISDALSLNASKVGKLSSAVGSLLW